MLGMTNAVAPGVAFFIAAIIGWVWLAALVMLLAEHSAQPAEPALTVGA